MNLDTPLTLADLQARGITITQENFQAFDFAVGFAFGPILRYRYYLDRVGFEAFMEIPIVAGYGQEHGHWGGGYPIFGVGVGM